MEHIFTAHCGLILAYLVSASAICVEVSSIHVPLFTQLHNMTSGVNAVTVSAVSCN